MPQHATMHRPHTVACFDVKRIQRIVGLPNSHVEPAPLERIDIPDPQPFVGILSQKTMRSPAEPLAPFDTPDYAFEKKREDAATEDLAYFKDKGSPYDGFVETPDIPDPFNHNDPWVASRTNGPDADVGIHPQLEMEADAWLMAHDKPAVGPQPTGARETSSWFLGPRVLPSDWRLLPMTYTLGKKKPCPRCHGNVNIFAKGPCHYCKGLGGWDVTRTKLTPWHPYLGWQKTPPIILGFNKKNEAIFYTPACVSIEKKSPKPPRIRGPFYGQARDKFMPHDHPDRIELRIRSRANRTFTNKERIAA